MREEYVAALEPYLHLLPTGLETRMRLPMLDAEGAAQAIEGPARAKNVTFEPAAVRALVDNLRRVQVAAPDGTVARVLGPYIEPVHLQVVCQNLWERLLGDETPTDERCVTAADLDRLDCERGDADADYVDRALAGYYDARVVAVASGGGVTEGALRRWIERSLVNERGVRLQVLREQPSSGGMQTPVLDRLVDTFLLRLEDRGGRRWFELAHDRLVEPVCASNAAWFGIHATELERKAQLWIEQGRRRGLLLYGDELREAERSTAASPSEAPVIVGELLKASLDARTRRQERRQQKLNRWIGVLVGLVLATAARCRGTVEIRAQGDQFGEAYLKSTLTRWSGSRRSSTRRGLIRRDVLAPGDPKPRFTGCRSGRARRCVRRPAGAGVTVVYFAREDDPVREALCATTGFTLRRVDERVEGPPNAVSFAPTAAADAKRVARVLVEAGVRGCAASDPTATPWGASA
jgi:hypothetical protein